MKRRDVRAIQAKFEALPAVDTDGFGTVFGGTDDFTADTEVHPLKGYHLLSPEGLSAAAKQEKGEPSAELHLALREMSTHLESATKMSYEEYCRYMRKTDRDPLFSNEWQEDQDRLVFQKRMVVKALTDVRKRLAKAQEARRRKSDAELRSYIRARDKFIRQQMLGTKRKRSKPAAKRKSKTVH